MKKKTLIFNFAFFFFPDIGIFNVVKFNNDPCDGDNSKNGTCYTEDECSNKGGKAEGSCAEG